MRTFVAIAVLAVVLSGCSTISVDSDYDRTAAFASYKTFNWLPRSSMRIQDPEFNQLLDRRIRNSIQAAMMDEGIQFAEENPDLLVAYHTGTQERTEVFDSGWGGYYGYGYGAGPGYRGSNLQTRYYTEGTLIVDLVDAGKKQLVWRGKAVGVVGDYDSQEARINEAVTEMFKQFPPTK